jgi:hypothetical protein
VVSDGAGQGITTMIVLQSLGQARARCGAEGTAALWDGCTVKIVLGGLADTRDLETVSRMCGDVDIEVPGRSYNAAGQQTRSFSRRRVPTFSAGQVRTLRRWHGLLFYEELRPLETSLAGRWELGRCPHVAQAVSSFTTSRRTRSIDGDPMPPTRHAEARGQLPRVGCCSAKQHRCLAASSSSFRCPRGPAQGQPAVASASWHCCRAHPAQCGECRVGARALPMLAHRRHSELGPSQGHPCGPLRRIVTVGDAVLVACFVQAWP